MNNSITREGDTTTLSEELSAVDNTRLHSSTFILNSPPIRIEMLHTIQQNIVASHLVFHAYLLVIGILQG